MGEKEESNHQPRFEADLPDDVAREEWLDGRRRDDGENVRTFVSDHWTLEYDLVHSGLGPALHTAIALARNEAILDRTGETLTDEERATVIDSAEKASDRLNQEASDREDAREYLACTVYKPLLRSVSKPMTAQHLTALLAKQAASAETSGDGGNWRELVPRYIRDAIEYVTGSDRTDSTVGGGTHTEGSVTA
jgi:putative ATP-dependent endonuclease of OLD family